MERDIGWKRFFSDDERYADVINGLGCNGRQVVNEGDLQELDTQTGFWDSPQFIRKLSGRTNHRRIRNRDIVRKVAIGMNFAIIGIENQDTIDYAIPLRNMSYDAGEYEKQAAKIRKFVRRNPAGLSPGEYLYGFKRDSRLCPTVTFVLYSGVEAWDGPKSLHEMLDFMDIPEELREMVSDYKINLIEIRKLEDTSIFQTDVRQVFDFIRCSENKESLKQLVESDAYYKSMEEDAFDVVVQYTRATELVDIKDYHGKDGKVDMCTAIKELIAEGRKEGVKAGGDAKTRTIVANMMRRGMEDADIMALAECSQELIDEVRETLKQK